MNAEARSRGAIVNTFLTQSAQNNGTTEDFIKTLVEGDDLQGTGGFSLVCGKNGEALAVISNRTPNVKATPWLAKERGETVGLSNAAFADRSWPKVLRGEELLSTAIKSSVAQHGDKASLVREMFQLLSNDTLPKRSKDRGWDSYVMELRNSIFIPPIGGEGMDGMSAEDIASATSSRPVNVEDTINKKKQGDGLSGVYGTQKQTVVLVDHNGMVTFSERTLFDAHGRSTAGSSERDRIFEFDIKE